MEGDILVLEQHHKEVAAIITRRIIDKIYAKKQKYIITVAGESGSGKSETGHAIAEILKSMDVKSLILGQDDYFVYPPKDNDHQRRLDDEWLGPHKEVKMDLLNTHISDAINGSDYINKPVIDYDQNSVAQLLVDISDIEVLILEGTYTSLLRNIDTRVFIDRNRLDTLEHRQKRNRGNEVGDPFIENVLKTEHKIIAGHKYLADFIITKDYGVTMNV